MKSFLLDINNKPTLKWGNIPDNVFFEGEIPENYYLAVCPGIYTILDVDVKNEKNGFKIIDKEVLTFLEQTFNYNTKSGGKHYWFKYTGDKILINKSTIYGIDLRIGANKNNCGGYVKYHHNVDIRNCTHLIKNTNDILNNFLEYYFT